MQKGNGKKLRRSFISSPNRPLDLLKRCPIYEATPLLDGKELASSLDLEKLWIKDESTRMKLGSFKALGAVFAISQMIMEKAGDDDPMGDEAKHRASELTFVTASAGNHGLSVAAGARLFGASAFIVLPKNAPENFALRIRSMGAKIMRGASYEYCVAMATQVAKENSWIHLADGSWPGYTEAPALIMEGYTVLAEECRQTFEGLASWPSHVYLQAGVGGMAAAVASHIRDYWSIQPRIIVVEPKAAPCLKHSVQAGELVKVLGPVSEMGRLDCKDASLIAFESLRQDADDFILVSDEEAKASAEHLAQIGITTTSSGSAGLAGLIRSMSDESSRCLVIVSEGRV